MHAQTCPIRLVWWTASNLSQVALVTNPGWRVKSRYASCMSLPLIALTLKTGADTSSESAYAIPLLIPVNSFRCNPMGRVYSTKEMLWQEGPKRKCAYMRLEFVPTTCALLFERLGNPTHSCRRALLPECCYRFLVKCTSFASRIICYKVHILPIRRSMLMIGVAGIFCAIQ